MGDRNRMGPVRTEPHARARASAGSLAEEPVTKPLSFGQWAVAVLLGCLSLGCVALAVRHVELVTGRYVTTGVPPVPAVAVLLLLVALRALLRKAPHPWGSRLALDGRQILLTFSMVCVGVALNGQYMVRAFLPHLVALQYWQSHNYSSFA